MTHEELEESVPLYAAGGLDKTERQALEAHLLSGCPSCHGALKDYQAVAALLPFGLAPVQADRALKARIMAARNVTPVSAGEEPKEPAKSSLEPGEWVDHLFPPMTPARSFSLPWAVGFATLVVIGIAAYVGWLYTSRFSEEVAKTRRLEAVLEEQSGKLAGLRRDLGERDRALTALRGDIQRRANDMAELKEQLIQRDVEVESLQQQLVSVGTAGRRKTPDEELAALLRRPDIRAISLIGSEKAKTATGVLLYDATTQKVWLYAVNLPECPNGTTYQLWAIDQQSKSIGTFHMDSGETAHLLVKRLPDFERAKKFAVSLEPPGGRPQPTGAIYLSSQF